MSNARAVTPPARAPETSADPPRGTDRIDEVSRLLDAAACFPLLGAGPASARGQAVPLLPLFSERLVVAIHLDAPLHRLETATQVGPLGPTARNRVGRAPIGEIRGRLTPIPDDFAPGPGLSPPPMVLNPFRSQRLALLNGEIVFRDRRASAIQMFGTGRTFPVTLGGQPALRFAAVIDVLAGAGDLAGLPGPDLPGAVLALEGFLRPPDDVAFSVSLRVMDPGGRLMAEGPALPVDLDAESPDSRAMFLFFRGEIDPQRPVRLLFGPAGRPIGMQLFESLRPIHCEDELATSGLLRSRTETGPVVGTRSALLYFDPEDPGRVIPAQATGGVFRFQDGEGRALGSLFANMVEGRAFRTHLPGAPAPVFRIGGFGPVREGSGELAGAAGMMTSNAVVSLSPRGLSSFYSLRLDDPDRRLRARFQETGSA